MEAVQGRVLLVGIQVRGEHEVLEPVRMLVDYPPARLVHRLRHHVLSGGVTGCEVEAEPAHPAQRVLLDVAKLAGSGRLFRLVLDGGEALVNPAAEVACGPSVAKHEHGCPLHGVVDDRRRNASRFAGDSHASVVAGDQSALGGRQRHEVLPFGVLAVNEQRAGEPQRYLGHAGEALHVARQAARRDRTKRLRRDRGVRPSRRSLPDVAPPPHHGCSRHCCHVGAGAWSILLVAPSWADPSVTNVRSLSAQNIATMLNSPGTVMAR